jgi:hypothetical protein
LVKVILGCKVNETSKLHGKATYNLSTVSDTCKKVVTLLRQAENTLPNRTDKEGKDSPVRLLTAVRS